ncbi:MAG: class I SAM-dependent methyltransferase [Flavobacteriaceae bacterium]|nr:class I SAM-dependent methyltransferase [Flavobacteriaceae bacterium]
MTPDPFGQALLDYQNNGTADDIETYSSVAGKDILPINHFFRSYPDMPKLEQKALDLCTGKVLDIGCGAGSHSLYLQEKGFDVTGIDLSKGAVETCQLRGLKKAQVLDFWQLKNQKYDSILLLMNGIGLCGTLDKLPGFFELLKSLLNPGGQILTDSSDIIYMYTDEEGNIEVPQSKYYGEVKFTMTYKMQKSKAFNWLYLDTNTLNFYAKICDLQCQLVLDGSHYDYLVKLFV